MDNDFPSLKQASKIRYNKSKKMIKKVVPQVCDVQVPKNTIMLRTSDKKHYVLINEDNIRKLIGEQFIMYIDDGNNILDIPVIGMESLDTIKKYFDTNMWDINSPIKLDWNISLISVNNRTQYLDTQTNTIISFLGLDMDLIINSIETMYKYASIYSKNETSIEKIVFELNSHIQQSILSVLDMIDTLQQKIEFYKKRGSVDVMYATNFISRLKEIKDKIIPLENTPIKYEDILDTIMFIDDVDHKVIDMENNLYDTVEHINDNYYYDLI